MSIQIIAADFQSPQHRKAVVVLLDAYARDPMGGGEALTADVKATLADALAGFPGAFSFIALDSSQPVGLLNGFTGFSTFKARRLLNIHDVYVAPEYRGKGISLLLLGAAEQRARELGCCKMTLEVLSANHAAKAAYHAFGFSDYALDPKAGTALFWQKPL